MVVLAPLRPPLVSPWEKGVPWRQDDLVLFSMWFPLTTWARAISLLLHAGDCPDAWPGLLRYYPAAHYWLTHTLEYCSAGKRRDLMKRNDLDGSQRHHAKQKKPDWKSNSGNGSIYVAFWKRRSNRHRMDLWLPGAWVEEGADQKREGAPWQYREVLLQLDSVGG